MTSHTNLTAGCGTTDIAAVLAPQLPDASLEHLTTRVAGLSLLPSHAAGLLEYLRSHPDALTSGEATGPSALRALLDVLAAEYPGVQRTRCHGCGAQRALPYRRKGASICGRCYSRAHLKVCVRCGELGRPDSREDGGIVCSRCNIRSAACARCKKVRRVAYRVDGEPLCQTCGPRKLYTCSSCGKKNQSAKAFTDGGPICSTCYARGRRHECCECGRTTVRARKVDRGGEAWICYRCWVPPTLMCSECRRSRPCARGKVSGRPLCGSCHDRRRRPQTCAMCKRTTRIRTTLPLGPICVGCYRKLRRSSAPCADCHEVRPLVGVGECGGSVCGPCSGDRRNWICEGCGQVDILVGGTNCLACSANARVRELLAGPDGRVPTQLEGIVKFLLEDNAPERTHEILNGSGWIQTLRGLVTAGRPITHQALDELPQDNSVGHLRSVLVYAAALDPQDDGLGSLGPWLKAFLTGAPPETVQLLRLYAPWSVLPRSRQRAARLGVTASAAQYARQRIETAAHFLAWLKHNDRTLADASQHDVDTWIADGASTRRRVRDFLKWAHARGLSSDLRVHWLGREGLAENVLDDDERWTLLRRCLRDDSVALRLRVAGALVLLYGQVPTRIVELTVDSLSTAHTGTYLVLRDQPVLLAPPLAALVAELASQSGSGQPTTSRGRSPAWLFPGTRPGTHYYAGRLATALNKNLGIFVRSGRGAALNALAADLPAPVLAELLGLSITTATRWSALAARDNAEYVAARIECPPT